MIFLFLVFMTCFIFLVSVKKPFLYPPGPASLPIFGNVQVLNHLKKLKFYHLLWHYLSKIYGDIVGLKFFNDYVIVVSGVEKIKQLYQKEDLNGRPDGFFFRVRSFDKRLGIVFTDGNLWEQQRLFSVKTFKALGLGKAFMIETIELEARELVGKILQNNFDRPEIPIQEEENNIFDVSVVNVMWKLLRGKRFRLNDPKVLELMEVIHKSFRIIDMSGGILNRLPFVRHILPNWSGYQPLVDTLRPLWSFLDENISEVSKSMAETNDTPQSFIEFYVDEMKKENSNEKFFSKEQLLAICVDFFQAGSETTSNTLAFSMLYMLHYPNVKRKIQKELDAVVGNRLPRLSDRPKLKYVEAVVCEVQRMANVAPLGIAHRALKSLKVDKFIIPKDSLVLFNIYSVHMDENYWDNPHEFRPERFLNEEGNVIQHENFFPFGLGKRRCIGENLAKNSLFHFFATLMHVFDIQKSAEGLPGLTGRDGITLTPQPFKAEFKRRGCTVEI